MKKNILIGCDHYLPGFRAGGPVRSIAAIVNVLKNEATISIITRNRDCGIKTPYENLSPNQYGYPVFYFSITQAIVGIFKLLKNHSFDIIYCNSFFSPVFTIYTLLLSRVVFRQKTKIIIAPRGELGSGALIFNSPRKKIYLFLMRRFLEKNIVWHATSTEEENDIKKIIGVRANIFTLANIALTDFPVSAIQNKKENELKIVFISRIIGKKNLEFALQVLAQVKGSIFFDIYGPIEEPAYWESCLLLIKNMPSNIVVNYKGALMPEVVAQTIQHYDLFFLPTLNENYGHAIVEAFSAGCPVMVSSNTPWRNLADCNAGWDFDLKNPAEFTKKLEALIGLSAQQYEIYHKGASEYFNQKINDAGLIEK